MPFDEKQYRQEYHKKNRKQLLEYGKEYRLKNKDVLRKKEAEYRKRNKDLIKIRKIQYKFKIQFQEAEQLFKRVKTICDICGQKESCKRFLLAVDHNHKTGKVRGVLCGSCNKGLGGFKDNIKLLKRAIKYLK